MMISKTHLTALALGVLIPLQGIAYFTPEDVLLSNEFFLPPTARESQNRTTAQQERAALRREREQETLFAEQRPINVLGEDAFADILQDGETVHSAAPAVTLTEKDIELLNTLRLLDSREQRLLDRVYTNQTILQYYGDRPEFFHGGAPPLSPTGLPGVLSAVLMVGAVGWTLRRAGRGTMAVVASK
jgi:hypothetical protein